MRKKVRRLIVAFYTTHDAMAFEERCLEAGEEGRLIPLPKEISAGCGLAWSAPPGTDKKIGALLELSGITPQLMRELDI